MNIRNVLWLDDYVHLYTGVAARLLDIPVELVAVSTSEEARHLMQERPFDLVLFDLILVGHQGGPSLSRYEGIEIAKVALAAGVQHLVAYTVLVEEKAKEALAGLDEEIVNTFGADGRLTVLNKSRCSAMQVVETVRRHLHRLGQ